MITPPTSTPAHDATLSDPPTGDMPPASTTPATPASMPDDARRCPTSGEGTPARHPARPGRSVLAEWVRRFCRLFDCGDCYTGGPCRVLAPQPQRCHEAEHVALVGAPDEVLGQYRGVLVLARAKAPDPPLGGVVDVAPATRGGRRCHCGAALSRQRRMCDGCRDEARRATKRDCERLRRERMGRFLAPETPSSRPLGSVGATK